MVGFEPPQKSLATFGRYISGHSAFSFSRDRWILTLHVFQPKNRETNFTKGRLILLPLPDLNSILCDQVLPQDDPDDHDRSGGWWPAPRSIHSGRRTGSNFAYPPYNVLATITSPWNLGPVSWGSEWSWNKPHFWARNELEPLVVEPELSPILS